MTKDGSGYQSLKNSFPMMTLWRWVGLQSGFLNEEISGFDQNPRKATPSVFNYNVFYPFNFEGDEDGKEEEEYEKENVSKRKFGEYEE